MNKEQIKEFEKLKKLFSTARPGVIKVFIEALELHAKKNNDYNNGIIDNSNTYNDNRIITNNDFELVAKFCDIRRKYARLQNVIVNKREMKVDEKLEDTAIDLLVYSALFLEHIKTIK